MSPVETLAASVLASLAERAGVSVPADALVQLAEQWVAQGMELLDGQAKKQASAAGQSAADAITTEDQAEAERRKP